jgi:hypothetical protein
MRNLALRFFLCLVTTPLMVLAFSDIIRAQSPGPVRVTPTILYRFRISNSDLGYFYTPWYSVGANAGYIYEGAMPDGAGGIVGIYVPPAGYTPDPAEYLTPLHQWTVIQNGWRTYYYYSTYYRFIGGDYHYNGVVGYVYPFDQNTHTYNSINAGPITATLGKVSAWYSQSYGYWYGGGQIGSGYILEPPPNGTYGNHGVVFATPKAMMGNHPGAGSCTPDNPSCHIYDALFYPPPPPPTCDSAEEQACYNNGGSWDSGSCSCTYYDPDPDPNPCGGRLGCNMPETQLMTAPPPLNK